MSMRFMDPPDDDDLDDDSARAVLTLSLNTLRMSCARSRHSASSSSL